MTLQVNTEQFSASRESLAKCLGILPLWVHEYVNYVTATGDTSTDLVHHMTERYGLGDLYRFEKGVVLEDGSYRSGYEEDEDLLWVGKMDTPDGVAYFYQYAIVALPSSEGGYFVTRMD